MSCKHCYNGCGTPTPDGCVKYTGPDIPLLGIETGDTLSMFEAAVVEKLEAIVDGTGIDLSSLDLTCDFIEDILDNDDPTLANIIQTLIKANCTLHELVTEVQEQLAEEPYVFSTSCLTLPANPTRDDILQATITKLCSLSTSVDDIDGDYVKATDLNTLIQLYLDSIAGDVSQFKNRMVPHVAYEYYGPLSNFDSNGVGLPALGFEDVYLCNGSNGTPDKRGRVAVGAIQGVPGGALDSAVDPSLPQNAGTNYVIGQKFGESYHTLLLTEIPSHTHEITDPGHTHPTVNHGNGGDGPFTDFAIGDKTPYTNQETESATTGITIGASGGNQPHNNRQPSIAAYYIMYID